MADRLRISGMVGLGGLSLPHVEHRLKALERGAKTMFADLGPPSRSWNRYSLSMPNSVRIIRTSRQNRNVIIAFEHGHIGLTLAPKTGQTVSNLISKN